MIALDTAHWPPTPRQMARLRLAGHIRHPLTEAQLAALEQQEQARQAERAVRQATALLREARGR